MPILSTVLTVTMLGLGLGESQADALARLKPQRLETIRREIAALRSKWQTLPRSCPYQDFRANLHVHSCLSHDSRGRIDEIVAAAKATGTTVLMFTEHPGNSFDYFKDGHRGLRDGVLLIPGAETGGFLVFPKRRLGKLDLPPQEIADLLRRGRGLVFLSHLEERMDWKIKGLTGTEIYNTHADFKDEKRLIAALRNPLWLVGAADLFRKYQQEAFSSLQDYPADYLRRWDVLCSEFPHTGVAANDSHQNTGLTIRVGAKGQLCLEDALGKELFELPAAAIPGVAGRARREGQVLFQILLDPYAVSFRHVSTHLLMPRLGEEEVWQCLESGRAYVAFDWLADPRGFDCALRSGAHRFEMGSSVALDHGMRLSARAPLKVRWKVLRSGKIIRELQSDFVDLPVEGPGNYRVEAWLDVGDQAMVWILSNPVYVRAPRSAAGRKSH